MVPFLFLALEIECCFISLELHGGWTGVWAIGAGSICITSTQSLQMGLSTDIISNKQKSSKLTAIRPKDNVRRFKSPKVTMCFRCQREETDHEPFSYNYLKWIC